MAIHLAVANRKGGVGKSTIAVMLAHGFSVWGKRRVLVVDLDVQCNSSLILLGGEGWLKAKDEQVTIADYFYDHIELTPPPTKDYVRQTVGDVVAQNGLKPALALLPGSVLLEDIQGELYLKHAKQSRDPDIVGSRVRGNMERLLRRFERSFEVVIYDCPPGLSLASLAALKTADKVLVPFRPDYVSRFAVDRIALLIEEKHSLDALQEIAPEKRRYMTLANYVRPSGPDRVLIEELAVYHPLLATQMPRRDAIADAFDWQPNRRSIEAKYGDAAGPMRQLYDEVRQVLAL